MPDLFGNQNLEQNQSLDSPILTSEIVKEDFLSPELKANDLADQIKWVITQRKCEYIDQILNLQTHKSVKVRRTIAKGLPKIASKDELEKIQTWQENEGDRETWLELETAIDKIDRGISDLETDEKVLTVTEAVTYLKRLVGEKRFVIEGEMGDVKLFQRSYQDIYYLGLKDKQGSRIDCMLLSRVAHRSGFPINEGIEVKAWGKFKIGKQSRLYFEIQKLELTGEGELLRKLKLLEEKLRKEGLFEESRKRIVPKLPKRILLLASPNSAAIKDFINVTNQRRKGLEIFHLPIKTQGVGAEFTILNALEQANRINSELGIDTVVMTRGGGSEDDLFVFNSEKIVRAVHGLNRPTIVAIGHERDITLAELAADLRCSTPSQAAEKASLSSSEVSHEINRNILQIETNLRNKIYQYKQASSQILGNVLFLIQKETQKAKHDLRIVDEFGKNLIFSIKREVWNTFSFIFNQVKNQLLDSKRVLILQNNNSENLRLGVLEKKRETSFLFESILRNVEMQKQDFNFKLKNYSSQIEFYDPKIILEKGYAMIEQNGQKIESKLDLKEKENFQIIFKDGKVEL